MPPIECGAAGALRRRAMSECRERVFEEDPFRHLDTDVIAFGIFEKGEDHRRLNTHGEALTDDELRAFEWGFGIAVAVEKNKGGEVRKCLDFVHRLHLPMIHVLVEARASLVFDVDGNLEGGFLNDEVLHRDVAKRKHQIVAHLYGSDLFEQVAECAVDIRERWSIEHS